MRYLYIFLTVIILATGCQEKDNLDLFDVDNSYVEFGQPTAWANHHQLYMDSTSFSFAKQSVEVDKVILAIPVLIIGQQHKEDREYNVKINKDETSINLALVDLSRPIIRSGYFVDTLFISIKKDKALKERVFSLAIDLGDNTNFGIGKATRTSCRFFISDQLTEPVWWTTWRSYFGQYKPEVYQQWIRIYKPGLDITAPLFPPEKPNYSWNNMPLYPLEYYYPVTFMYIEQLKKYFQDNEVYPNGDRSLPRIYLP